MKKTIWMLGFIFLMAMSQSFAKDSDGNEGGHGGDEIGLEFIGRLHVAFQIIKKDGGREFEKIVHLKPEKFMANVSIIVVDTPLLITRNGITQECTAVNNADEKTIRINRTRWNNIIDPKLKEAIALHEAISLLSYETTGSYPYSGAYLTKFGYSPDAIYGNTPDGSIELPNDISRVYSYKCKKKFFEGEGVNQHLISCNAGQHLGFLFAEYYYYLHSSNFKNNFKNKATDSFFEFPICGIRNVDRYTCDMEANLEYGLAVEADNTFRVSVTMTASPENGSDDSYGFAALPLENGKCPKGLVRARPYIAQPRSIMDPLPTNFINSGDTLNNNLVAIESESPKYFTVWRKPAITPCGPDGMCDFPNGKLTSSLLAPYVPLTPTICVIPKSKIRD